MDVGMTLTIRNYPDDPESLVDVYRRNLEDAAYAEQLRFDFVWVSEHHFAPDAWSPSPLHVLTAIAALRKNSFEPDNFNHQLFGSGHLSDTWDRAWDEVQDGLYYHRAFYEQREWIAHKTVAPFGKLQPPAKMRHDPENRPPVGTPDDILRKLEPLLKDSRITHYGFGFRHVKQTTAMVRHSMDLFAREVMPVLRAGAALVPPRGRSLFMDP